MGFRVPGFGVLEGSVNEGEDLGRGLGKCSVGA